jgi:hypothetical protein
VVNWYADKYGYDCVLPEAWEEAGRPSFMLAAWVADGVYAERWVAPDDVTVTSFAGEAEMVAHWDWINGKWTIEGMDLDAVGGKFSPGTKTENLLIPGFPWFYPQWAPTPQQADVYARWVPQNLKHMWVQVPGIYFPIVYPYNCFLSDVPGWTTTGCSCRPKLAFNQEYTVSSLPWRDLDAEDMEDALLADPRPAGGSEFMAHTGTGELFDRCYIMRTYDGRLAKMQVTRYEAYVEPTFLNLPLDRHRCRFTMKYIAFDNPSAVPHAEVPAVYDATMDGIALGPGNTQGADSYHWELVSVWDPNESWDPNWTATTNEWIDASSMPQTWKAWIDGSSASHATLYPDFADGNVDTRFARYLVRLTINKGKTGRELDEDIVVAVPYPIADAGPDQQVSVSDVLYLNAAGSKGARTWHWSCPGVTINDYNKANATVDRNTLAPGDYIFKLEINKGYKDADDVTVKITVS